MRQRGNLKSIFLCLRNKTAISKIMIVQYKDYRRMLAIQDYRPIVFIRMDFTAARMYCRPTLYIPPLMLRVVYFVE